MNLSEHDRHEIDTSDSVDAEAYNNDNSASSQPTNGSSVSTTEAVDNLDKIRDILFGQQVSEQQQQLQTLDQKLAKECDRLRSDFYDRIQTMEDRLSDRLKQLTERLDTEVADKNKAVEQLHHKLEETTQTFEQTTSSLSEKANEATQDLQAEIKHQTLTLKDSIEEQIYELISQLEEETQARKASTVSQKHHLSTLLRTLSDQLQPEAKQGDT